MSSRRSFLKVLPAPLIAGAFPTIVKPATLGRAGFVPPSDRVTIATIGTNWMGMGHVEEFLNIQAAQVVGVCDVDELHLKAGKDKVDKRYGNNDCTAYRAFEELLSRRDVDAVSIAVPDHWHGIIAVMAARAGKDVYGEKPIAHTLYEGQAIRNAIHKNNRIWQTGSWQRSRDNFRQACELVRNGRVGKIARIEVGLPGGHSDFDKTGDRRQVGPPPATLNWDRWLGPAPEAGYCEARVHKVWRWNLDYGGGQLMDWVGHHVDIAHWGMGWDKTGPSEVFAKGEFPARDALWNAPTKFVVDATYPGNVKMVISGGYPGIRSGTKWIGESGWIWVDRGGIEASDPAILKSEIKSNEISLPKSPGHYLEFINAVRTRGTTLTPSEVAVNSATPGWLGMVSMQVGRKIKWDAASEKIIGDAEASKLLRPSMRSPYNL